MVNRGISKRDLGIFDVIEGELDMWELLFVDCDCEIFLCVIVVVEMFGLVVVD